MDIDDFFETLSTIRLARRLEETQTNRALASISYAIWFSQVPPKKRKSFDWYLKELGLDKEPEKYYLGEYPGAEEQQETKTAGEPTDAEIEAFIESGGNEWGRITVVHLQEYKARRAKTEESQP